MNIKQKLATGLMTSALCASLFASTAFANGNHGSKGTVTITSTNCTVVQNNSSFVLTGVNSQANTGGNNANNNGGKKSDPSIKTGNAQSGVQVGVSGSGNAATNPCCGCATSGVTPAIDPKGKGNSVTITNNSTTITQSNQSSIVTNVNSQANTGGNTANNNVGGNVSIQTGDATSAVSVQVGGSSNTLN